MHDEHDTQEQHNHHDHSQHHRMMIRDFRTRFFIVLILSLPVLALSEVVQGLLGYQWGFPGAEWLVFGLATLIYVYGGRPFLTGFVDEMRARTPGMMTLIALAISVAYFYSAAVTFFLEGTPFYWELATLIAIMLAGHWIEMASVLSASSALEKLAQLMPHQAHRKRGETVEDIELAEVQRGDILLVKPGEKIPADGRIEKGSSYLDESMLTGESRPVQKQPGDTLIGGSINGSGSLELQVESTGEDSYLSTVIAMVRTAQAEKSKTQSLSDRAAFWLTIIAISVGTATLITWLLIGQGLQFSIARMAAVMVITCPHALGLAIPLVVSVSTAQSAEHGLLIRNRTAFENARRITTVVFDKTGTLTKGVFEVSTVQVFGDSYSRDSVLGYAAALERDSEHPIGAGISRLADSEAVSVPTAEGFQNMQGKGITGRVEGHEVQVASRGYLEAEGIAFPGQHDGGAAGGSAGDDDVDDGGVTRVFVVIDRVAVGSIALADTIRPESQAAIATLQRRGIRCWMLTGDSAAAARAVAEELGMDGWFAEVLPDQKQAKLRELQDAGEYVAMAGDGVNDSPALAQAQIGIAVGSGTDVAAAASDIVLVNSNPQDISALILFGRATYRKMVQNLIWAAGYNIVAIPLAAGVLASVGVLLSPEVGAVLMSLSTVVVAINARLLRMPARSEGE